MRNALLYMLGTLAIGVAAFALARGLRPSTPPPTAQPGDGPEEILHRTPAAPDPAAALGGTQPTKATATMLHPPRHVKALGGPQEPQPPVTAARPALVRLEAAFKEQNGDAIEGTLTGIRAWIGSDAKRALELIAELDGMADPNAADTLVLLLRDMDPEISAAPEVVQAFYQRSTAAGTSERARATSILFLALANELGEERLRGLAQVGRQDGAADVRRAAMETLGSYLGRYPDAAKLLTPVLLEALQSDTDPNVRMQAASGLRVREDPDATLPTVVRALQTETREDTRLALVGRLGDAPATHRAEVMRVLDGLANDRETDAVRGQVVVAAVQVGGEAALPILERLAQGSGPVAQDAADYRDILKKGERDFERIYEAKSRLEAARGGPVVPDDDHHEGE
ncbi:MAG: HEAT repeat domain-containing protein [Planctomycetes bacterium]|nr:HEAT repeat domain-containing protein [Planctomycetota bacterium]